jgi:hypothetical protein
MIIAAVVAQKITPHGSLSALGALRWLAIGHAYDVPQGWVNPER